MFGFLPEKVYAKVKNDANYITYEAQINAAVASNCLVERIVKEEQLDKVTLLATRNEVITRLCTEEEQRSVTIMETSDKATLLSMLETETDAENTLLIYQQLVGICLFASNPEARPYMDEYIFMCENTNNDFCEKIWEEYFTFVCFKKIFELFADKIFRMEDFDTLKNLMEIKGAEIKERFKGSDYITDLIEHIKIKMSFYYLGYLLDNFGTISPIGSIIENKILPYIENISFKYSSFNLFKLRIYDCTAKYYFDVRSRKYFEALDKTISLINLSIVPINKAGTIKAVNYYNDRLGFDMLNLLAMYRKITTTLLPEFRNKIDLTNLTQDELDITSDITGSVAAIKERYGLNEVVNNVVEALSQKQTSFMTTYLAGNERHYEYMRTLYQVIA